MRHAVLSISEERVAGAIRNTVLAHSGYGVIPAANAHEALRILGSRHVCAMVIPSSVPRDDQRMLCIEGKKRGVASVVLDPYGPLNSGDREVHFNPLDGPEAFLKVLESAVRRDHRLCIS